MTTPTTPTTKRGKLRAFWAKYRTEILVIVALLIVSHLLEAVISHAYGVRIDSLWFYTAAIVVWFGIDVVRIFRRQA